MISPSIVLSANFVIRQSLIVYKSEVRLSQSASTLAYKFASYNVHRYGVAYLALEVLVNIYEDGPIYHSVLSLFIAQKTLRSVWCPQPYHVGQP